MSQRPSNLPEQRAPLRPDEGEDYEYITVEEEISNDATGGGRGCLRGVIGLTGCFLLISALCVGAIFVSGRSLEGVFASFPRIQVPSIFGWESSPRAGIYVPDVERVRTLSELSTVRYNYAGVVTSEQDMPDILDRLYGNQQVMVAVGHIRAGIDTSQITPENIVYDTAANTLTLQLPAPELQECFLNENESYVVERRSGVFAAPAPNLDTSSRRYAIEQYRIKALEDGILQEAAAEAEATLREFLQAVVGTETEIIVTTAPAEPPDADALPDTCR